MKTLEEINAIKTGLEKDLLSNPEVNSVNIGTIGPSEDYPGEKYAIRVFVNSANINHKDLGLNKLYKGVPIIIQHRKIELH